MTQRDELFVGVEIGGTKLQAALGTADGQILSHQRITANAAAGREGICDQVVVLIQSLLAEQKINQDGIQAIGVGFGGPVDVEQGTVFTSHQVAGWDNFPIVDWLQEKTNRPVFVNNDSDLAGLAEARIGAGRNCSPVVYMNIGSGIGGAIVLDGKLFPGQGIGASEIGHQRLCPADGAGWDTLESLASGWSLSEQAKNAALANPKGLLGKQLKQEGQVSTECLARAVSVGDPIATEIWSHAIECLGVVIANVITLLHPQRVVVGGGVAQVGNLLFRPLRDEVQRHVFAAFRESYEIVPAQLEQMVVLHGALIWAGESQNGPG